MKTAKIDMLGRVVIPVNYRKRLNLQSGSNVIISLFQNSVVLTPSVKACKLCGQTVFDGAPVELCEECIHRVKAL